MQKLEKLLHFPSTFRLEKAKVILLRITIPMDFYSSPITVDIEGVDVRLKVNEAETKSSKPTTKSPEDSGVLPHTVDLAQSFLDAQPRSERKELEDALAAETQDLGASVTVSDDGSEDEGAMGTGQPLSLPNFLAEFLQGIADRLQVKINGVRFQLDLEVPPEPTSPTAELVSFQIALDKINVEGLTTNPGDEQDTPAFAPKEGKRQISLENVRAYLVSEANVFAALARSPSIASPSVVSSPSFTRNPPSRETSSLSQGSFHQPPMLNLQESFRSGLTYHDEPVSPHFPLTDSEEALAIPYDMSDPEDEDVDESPPTPRASFHQYQRPQDLHESMFHSTQLPGDDITHSTADLHVDDMMHSTAALQEEDVMHSTTSLQEHDMMHSTASLQDQDIMHSTASLQERDMTHSTAALEDDQSMWSSSVSSQPLHDPPNLSQHSDGHDGNLLRELNLGASSVTPISDHESPRGQTADDLAESHLYTHEYAESMYMSAYSSKDAPGDSKPTALSAHGQKSVNDLEHDEKDSSSDEIDEDDKSPSHIIKEYDDQPLRQEQLEASNEGETEPAGIEPQAPSTPKLQTAEVVLEEPRNAMPGGWDDSPATSPRSEHTDPIVKDTKSPTASRILHKSDSEDSLPAFSRANIKDEEEHFAEEGPATNDESPPDEAATPRGSTRLVKEILSLKMVSLYIPSQHTHIHAEHLSPESVAHLEQSLGRSIYPQAPGAFSVHSTSARLPSSPPLQSPELKDVDKSLEVDLSPLNINFDASLGFLLAMVVMKLLQALKSEKPTPVAKAANNEAKKEGQQKGLDLKISLQELSLNFLNQLRGVADTAEAYLGSGSFMFQPEVLLNMTLQGLRLSSTTTETKSPGLPKGAPKQLSVSTNIELEKFRFGYADGDIVSFDSTRPMSTSVRDTFLAAGSDVGVKMLQVGDRIRTDVETRPLVLQVDLQRLDETFSWFGGLSSFLNMSASMTSSASPTIKSSSLPVQKPRGVRFDTPIDPNDRSAAGENKLNVRIGGVLVELVGKDCSLAAESSAVKIVSRDSGIGLACTMMRLSGPYLRNSDAEPAITTELSGVRLDFLSTPKDTDLERLLELITPSKAKFDSANDEIIVDTLLRQRKKGSVLRVTVDAVKVRVKNMAQLTVLPNLGEEIAKLSTVAKYLPEDDRPGLLTLSKLKKVGISLDFGGKIGHLGADISDFDVGHITVPSLVAIAVAGVSVVRNGSEELVHSSVYATNQVSLKGPVIMARMIGDDIDSVVKLKLQDIGVEYRVPMLMDILGLAEDATPQDFEASLAASIADLGDQTHSALARQPASSPASKKPDTTKNGKPLTLDIGFRDCIIGLNPLDLTSKMAIVLTDANVEVVLPTEVETKVSLDINKGSILLVDDVANLSTESSPSSKRRSSGNPSQQVAEMCGRGFVDVSYISSAKVVVKVLPGVEDEKQVLVDVKDDLFVLETCADSTQTLITLANALKPPTPPSKENKYRTNVVPVQDLLASISAEAFGRPEGEYDFDTDFAGAQEMAGSGSDMGYTSDSPLRVESQYYDEQLDGEEMFDATKESMMSQSTSMVDTKEGVLLTNSMSQVHRLDDGEELEFDENFFARGEVEEHATAKVWNSQKNAYDRAPKKLVEHSPLKVSVRDVHFIWNLFDGYDWGATREIISKAVHEVEARAIDRQTRLTGQRAEVYDEIIDEEEEAIGDFLFNSIYIGIPANRDPHELSRAINEGLNDNATETESIATTAQTGATNRTVRPHHSRSKRLRLHRSKHHKITFELKGINVDMMAYPPDSGETQSSIDIRVTDLDVFDHVPTSTWKKFATYDQDQGEREMGTSMAHLELLNVKPIPGLGAAEIVLRVTILPLRLHVDQDALDFITRFFEFKDDKVPVHSSPSDVPFLQRAEVMSVPVKLDFKPKRVDYAGLRSGHTTEFMNFIVLEESRMVLRHCIIYGVSGFDRFGKTLNDIWTPDVRNNQLPGVIAGLAPVRSLVNIGSGIKDLVEIPIREYKKDGRVVRSISKGAMAFARTTGTELVKLGAKLAVGTQYALQGAEGMLGDQSLAEGAGWAGDDDDLDAEEKKQISLYADQPTGVIQGIKGGYRSLTRDMNMAKDAIIAVPGEVMESSGASGAARAVWKRAPTIIFRPAVGVTKVIGQTLMGATNSIDPHNRRRINEVCIPFHKLF